MNRIQQMALAAVFGTAIASPSAMANLVADPGFELEDGSWAVSGWGIADFGRGAHTGIRSASTGCIDSGDLSSLATCTMSQTVATSAGAAYDISFWLYADGLAGNDSSAFPNGLRVWFDGLIVETILDFASTNPDDASLTPGGASTLITIHGALASTGSTVLAFGGFDNPAQIFVDDVRVEPAGVPEPASLSLLGLGLAGLGFVRRRMA